MPTPMNADQIRSQLTRWGVTFHEMPNWDGPNSGRDDETGKVFGPVFGCVTHHTGSDGSDKNNRELILEGRSDLPGPLAQFGLNDNGVVDLFTPHRANHAGGGDPDVLQAVKDESYDDFPPDTHEHEGSDGAVDGNDCFYGCEAYYSGAHERTDVAYRTLVRLWAAICEFHGWPGKRVIGHREWSDIKPDPGHIDMRTLRSDVDAALAAGPDGVAVQEGPKMLPPRIAEAMRLNIAYAAALDRIVRPNLQDDIRDFRRTLRTQRQVLQEEERR